ncbi:uncharacterized protein [Dermacentor albipictus]|uniref:uncharacterized protein n=1 Tax=Dermacentor albipictus TaxID=60249 RepID=UPI0038FD3339
MEAAPSTSTGRATVSCSSVSSSPASTDGPSPSTGVRPRGRPRKTEAQKAETKARHAEAMRRKRRGNAELREREVQAKRQRRTVSPELRAREAEIKRQRGDMNPQIRAREAEVRRQQRQGNPDLRAREAAAKRQQRQEDPEYRAREAEARRQQRQQDAGLRAREAEAKRQQRQEDPEFRAREADARRQQRQENSELRTNEAQARRQQRQDCPEIRAREAEAKRLRRRAEAEQRARERLSLHASATNMFHKRFTQNPFGYSCSVCDRLWHKNDLKPLPEAHATLVADAFRTDVSGFEVCRTCMQTIRRNRIPNYSTTNGYAYPPKPAHLPNIDLVSERLVSPRIPFMQIRRLLYSNSGQFAIRGPIVNVPINVDTTVQMLPRDVEEDQALCVHIKRRMIYKSVYIRGMVKKTELLPWLVFLEKSTLYRYYGIRISREKADKLCDKVVEPSDENAERIDDPVDHHNPMETALAMSLGQQTLIIDDSNVLVVAPGEGITPVSIVYDQHAEELSFPQIYLGEPRNISPDSKPSVYTMASSECRRTDRRGATAYHVLYMAAKVMRTRVASSVNVFFRNTSGMAVVTKAQLNDREFVENAVDHDMAFMNGVPNTVQYWHRRKQDVFAMIRQLGKPTAFLTLSASEIHWDGLMRLLQRLHIDPNHPQVPFEQLRLCEKSMLVSDDPVVCSVYFDHIVRVIMQILQHKTLSPFAPYVVKEYFKRIEFQHRGSAHAHLLLWLENAPHEELGPQMPETVRMAEHLISLDAESLHRPRCQTHQHTQTCYKNGRTKCRFNAPFWPMEESRVIIPLPPAHTEEEKKSRTKLKERYNNIHTALETTVYESIEDMRRHNNVADAEEYITILRAGISRPTLMLKRNCHQVHFNFFNPWIASVLNSNMDLQIVLDVYACAAYVVEYVNKANRGMSNLHKDLRAVVDESPHSSVTYTQALRQLSVKMLKAVEMSAQEAAWYLLGLGMSHASRVVVTANTSWPEERVRIRKSRELMDRDGLDESSTDVWCKTTIQKYEDRPEDQAALTYAEHLTSFNDNGRPRAHPAVLRYHAYSVSDVLNFKREHVLLFHPFQREVDILDNNKFVEIYDSCVSEILAVKARFSSPHIDLAEMEELCKNIINEEVAQRDAFDTHAEVGRRMTDLLVDVNDDSDILGEVGQETAVQQAQRESAQAAAARCPAVQMRTDIMPTDVYLHRMRMMNAGQYEIVREVIHRLTTPDSEPLQVFFTGAAGCGKTFVLRTIMDVYNRYFRSGNRDVSINSFVACATTGKAAVAIGGVTVHAAFKLVVSGKNPDRGLSSSDANSFRCIFKDVKCVIIDEISMMSADTLVLIDRRLRTISLKYTEPFGGFDVILCGDLRQLPPVRAAEVYRRSKLHQSVFDTESMPWHNLSYFQLKDVVRQSDERFATILTKIGDGIGLTVDEVSLLESRFVTTEEAANKCPSGVRLFYTNKDADAFNIATAEACTEYAIHCPATDTICGHRSDEEYTHAKVRVATMSKVQMANLAPNILLCLEKPYMVIRNIDVSDSLVNGSVGILRLVQRDTDDNPLRLWIEFPTGVGAAALLKGRRYRANDPDICSNWVPIELITIGCHLKGHDLAHITVRRKQFPVVQASAITIHKSQGGTYDEAVVDYSKSHNQKLVYVALSRVTTIDGLYLTNKDNDHRFHHFKENPDRALADEFRRLGNHRLQTITAECNKMLAEYFVTVGCVNVRSLGAHSLDVAKDFVLANTTVLCFTETWMDRKPPYDIDGYRCISAAKRSDNRAAGVAIYVKREVQAEDVFLVQRVYEYGEVCAVRLGSVVIACIYIAPGTGETAAADLIVRELQPWIGKETLLVVGDFNQNVRISRTFPDMLHVRAGLQMATPMNAISTNRNSCIDLAFHNQGTVKEVKYCSCHFTDHKAMLLAVGRKKPTEDQQVEGEREQAIERRPDEAPIEFRGGANADDADTGAVDTTAIIA